MALRKRVSQRYDTYQDNPQQFFKDNVYGILMVATVLLALYIRLIPRKNMEYMQALDPYMISRLAETIVTEGHLPAVDAWRYFPYITPTYHLNLGNIYIPAYLYKVFGPVTGLNFVEWTQFYPALLGAGMVLVMYFIGKEMFDQEAGLLAAFFLAVSPAVLHRSSAGWFEKEPIGAFLMFTSIYFVTRAWKRQSWPSGIVSGFALGLAVISWGGAKALILLYPLAIFPIALLNEDIRNMIAAFTPTILIGHILPAILNAQRWSVPNGMFIAAIGVLGLIWARYIAEEYDLVEDAYLKYVTPGLTLLGGFLLFLSPLYSQRLAGMVQGLINSALQSGGGVVGGTVAENTPARTGQIVGQLGVGRIQQMAQLQSLYPWAELFSGWTLSIIGTSVLLTMLGYMLLRKFDVIDTVTTLVSYFAFGLTTLILSAILMALLPGSGGAFIYPIGVALIGGAALAVFAENRERTLNEQWYLIIPLLWIASTLFAATQRSRILFLTSQPVALMAGFGLSVALKEIRNLSIWQDFAEQSPDLTADRILVAVIALLLIPIIVVNTGAAFSMANAIGGSPNSAWMENLEYMRESTPVDSVILSWWDYGYWFETIGGRAAIADGGNLAFYSKAPGYQHSRNNMPLADFLTAEDYTQHMDWLRDRSVDYVVLDSSMIGKYSAVSQISNRDNSKFSAMQTLGCAQRNGQCVVQQSKGQQFMIYQGRGARVLVPVRQQGNGISLAGAPMFQTQQGTAPVQNFCSPNGINSFDINQSQQSVPGCVAWDPYRGQQRLIYIPQDVMRSTLVDLYVMDGANMPEFEKVEGGSNGYVKMWNVKYDESQQ